MTRPQAFRSLHRGRPQVTGRPDTRPDLLAHALVNAAWLTPS